MGNADGPQASLLRRANRAGLAVYASFAPHLEQ
jgi:hypothetical protein